LWAPRLKWNPAGWAPRWVRCSTTIGLIWDSVEANSGCSSPRFLEGPMNNWVESSLCRFQPSRAGGGRSSIAPRRARPNYFQITCKWMREMPSAERKKGATFWLTSATIRKSCAPFRENSYGLTVEGVVKLFTASAVGVQ
jgi:hypothetical protein